MKKFLSILIISIMLCGIINVSTNSYAYEFSDRNSEITVLLNGEEISFDQPPVIIDNRTMVPLRAIFEALGATVNWDGENQTVRSAKNNATVQLTIGEYEFYRNGVAISIDVPGTIVNDRTLVPVRAISEAFNCQVNWDGDTKTVGISYNGSDSFSSETGEILLQYARDNLSILYEDDYIGKPTYTDVRFLLADVSGDDEPELLAVGVADNEMCYLEIYRYENGNIIKILDDHFGYAYGRAIYISWYDGGVRVGYESGSSATGFRDCLLRYNNGDWIDVYESYIDFDYDNDHSVNGYFVNGEYVSEEEFDAARERASKCPVTLSDFVSIPVSEIPYYKHNATWLPDYGAITGQISTSIFESNYLGLTYGKECMIMDYAWTEQGYKEYISILTDLGYKSDTIQHSMYHFFKDGAYLPDEVTYFYKDDKHVVFQRTGTSLTIHTYDGISPLDAYEDWIKLR